VNNSKKPGCQARKNLSAQPPGNRPLLPLGLAVVAGLLGAADVALAEEDKTLSAVTVTATQEPPDGYRASKTRVGKVVQDPHDVPQAITTVTRALMEEQEANSLREALRNVSGLTFNAAEGGRSGDNMMLRGFYTFGDMYLDGIRDTAQYNREVFNLEQVDVLRGSAAMLFGRGQAGGVINQVSKTPMLYGINKAGVGVGSNGFQELKADLNQRIGDTTAIRLNVMNRDEGSARSNPYTGSQPEIHRTGVAPSIAFGLGTDHEVTFSHLWVKTRDTADYGIPFVSGRPNEAMAKAGNYYGVDANFDNSDTNITTASYLYKISPDTQWRTVLRKANYKRSYWAVAGQGTLTAASTSGQAKTREFETDNYVMQSDFNTAFSLLGMRHEVVTGVEYLREESIRWSLRNLGTTNNPMYVPGSFTGTATTYSGDTYSAYVQDTVEFIRNWKATLGIRRDEMRAQYSSLNSPSLNFGQWSYRTGLSWQPDPAAHYYVSWSDSFSPTADLYQLSGGELPPERSQVSEVGGKWLFMDGDLSFRTAIYTASKDWERNTDLESTAALLSKKRTTNGIEFEMAGRITSNWEVFGGIALMAARVNEQYEGTATGQTFAQATSNGTANGGLGYATGEAADASQLMYTSRSQQVSEGHRPRNTPAFTANLWTTYRFAPDWKAGLGFEAKSSRAGYGVGTCGTASQNATTRLWSYSNCSTNFAPNTVPGYVRWDAMLTYEQPSYSIKFNIQNLFDRVYYDALYDNGGFTIPGQARRFILSSEFKF
jgi:catecholate siderophore receptor